jgi:hypothetical protein
MLWSKKSIPAPPKQEHVPEKRLNPAPIKEPNPEAVAVTKTNMVKVFAETNEIVLDLTNKMVDQYKEIFWKQFYEGIRNTLKEGHKDGTFSFNKYSIPPYSVGITEYTEAIRIRLYIQAYRVIVNELDEAGVPYTIRQGITDKEHDRYLSFDITELAKYCNAEKLTILV